MAKVDIDDHTDLAIEYGVRYTVISHTSLYVSYLILYRLSSF